MNLLQVESFENTFGPKRQRKKPKMGVNDITDLAQMAQQVDGIEKRRCFFQNCI